MRLGLLVVGILLLAGCASQEPETNDAVARFAEPCAIGICMDPDLSDDTDLPETGSVLLGLRADAVTGLANLEAYGDGWAWTISRPEGRFVEVLQHGELLQTPMPAGTTHVPHGLLVDPPWIYATTQSFEPSDGPQLLRWNVETSNVTWTPLEGLESPVIPKDLWRGNMVMQLPKAGIRGQEGIAWMDGPPHESQGRTLDGASTDFGFLQAQRFENSTKLILHAGHEQRHQVFEGSGDVLGVWGSPQYAAFSYVEPGSEGPRIFEVSSSTHEVTLRGQGDFAHYMGTTLVFENPVAGGNPLLQAYNRDLDGISDIGFLSHDQGAWTTTADQVAWIHTPSIDQRFDESPNPTEFQGLLLVV